MNIIDTFPRSWVVDIQVTGPTHRNADGYLTTTGDPVTIEGCLLAPGSSDATGVTSRATVEAPDDIATLYTPPDARIRQRDTVTVPTTHALAGRWTVEATPAPYPLGLAVPLARR